MTARRTIDVARHFIRPPLRTGFSIVAAGRPVGVVVSDERPRCSGSACRLCCVAVYDLAVLDAASWLVGHLAAEHGVERLAVDARGAGRLAAPLAAALAVGGRRAVA